MVVDALHLADEVLAGARISGKDLDRVLLVGGLTQMPFLRSAITSRLGAKIDFSLDPMSVVARGAALYAATIELDGGVSEYGTGERPTTRTVSTQEKPKLRLAYEPVSARLTAMVGGRLTAAGGKITEIKLDGEGAYWTSGWSPVPAGTFELPVVLQEGKSSRFFIDARDVAGTLIDVEPDQLSIRHGRICFRTSTSAYDRRGTREIEWSIYP